MDRIDQDLNAHQADLDAREQLVEELKACPSFCARLKVVCESLLDDEPQNPSCTLALSQAINVCERAYAALSDHKTALFENIKDCTLKQMVVDNMVLYSLENEGELFDKVLGEFM